MYIFTGPTFPNVINIPTNFLSSLNYSYIYLIHVIINELGKTNLQPEHLKGIHIFHITYHYPSSISFVCQFDMCVNLVDSNIYCPNY